MNISSMAINKFPNIQTIKKEKKKKIWLRPLKEFTNPIIIDIFEMWKHCFFHICITKYSTCCFILWRNGSHMCSQAFWLLPISFFPTEIRSNIKIKYIKWTFFLHLYIQYVCYSILMLLPHHFVVFISSFLSHHFFFRFFLSEIESKLDGIQL